MGNKKSKNELHENDLLVMQYLTRSCKENVAPLVEKFYRECHNGALNKQTFIRFYKELIKETDENAEEYCELVFEAFDSDKSGTIEFKEFLLALTLSTNGPLEEKLYYAFDIYDQNNDGFVECYEMEKAFESIFKLMKINDLTTAHQRAKMVFKTLDVNKDKKITRQEFINGCLEDEFLRYLLIPTLQACDD